MQAYNELEIYHKLQNKESVQKPSSTSTFFRCFWMHRQDYQI